MLQPQTIEFSKLRGVQTRKALTDFNQAEAVTAVGGYFDINGSYTKRRGGEKYNTTSLANEITGLYDFRYDGGSSKIIIGAGTNIYEGNSGSPSSIKTGMTAGEYYSFSTYQDYCFFTNGTDGLFKYDGTDVTNVGIEAPLTSPTASQTTGGSLALGDYIVAVTFVNDSDPDYLIESNPCTEVTVTISGINNAISLTSIPVSSDAQVTKRYIYVTTTDGAILYFNDEIADNVTTTFTITAFNNAGAELEYDHDTPPVTLNYIDVWKDRLWGASGNKIYFTKDFRPWYWPQGILDAEQKFFYEVGNSDHITGVKAFDDIILIFKENDVFFISGDNELNFTLNRIRSDERVGCVSNRTIKVINNYCYFLGRAGVYRTNGVGVEDVSWNIGESFNDYSTDTTFQISKNYMQKACAEYVKDKNLYLLFIPVAAETNNTMCFAMDTQSLTLDQEYGKISANWSYWKGITTQSVALVLENGKQRWFRGDEQGYIFRQDQLDGDGSNVTSTSTGSNTSTTLNDTNQSWTTNLYAGLTVYIISGYGRGQQRAVVSNSSTQLVVSSAWDTTPNSTSKYAIGGIPYAYQHGWHDYGNKSLSKRLRFIRPRFDTSGNFDVSIYYGYDFTQSDLDEITIGLATIDLWDDATWDVSSWDGSFITQNKLSVPGNRVHIWSNIKIENNAAGQPIKYNGFDKIFQMKGIR